MLKFPIIIRLNKSTENLDKICTIPLHFFNLLLTIYNLIIRTGKSKFGISKPRSTHEPRRRLFACAHWWYVYKIIIIEWGLYCQFRLNVFSFAISRNTPVGYSVCSLTNFKLWAVLTTIQFWFGTSFWSNLSPQHLGGRRRREPLLQMRIRHAIGFQSSNVT